jgi:hypothetical protein
MTRYGRMQRVMLWVLAVMLAASFLLAAASFIWPMMVHAAEPCQPYSCSWEFWYNDNICGNPCGVPAGTRLFYRYWWEREKCCCQYAPLCWYSGWARKMFGGCWCAIC